MTAGSACRCAGTTLIRLAQVFLWRLHARGCCESAGAPNPPDLCVQWELRSTSGAGSSPDDDERAVRLQPRAGGRLAVVAHAVHLGLRPALAGDVAVVFRKLPLR